METSLISKNNLQLWPNCTPLPWISHISCQRLQLSNVPQEESLCPCADTWKREGHGAKGENSFEIPIHMMVVSCYSNAMKDPRIFIVHWICDKPLILQ